MWKSEVGPLSYTIHSNQLKIDESLKHKTLKHENLKGIQMKSFITLVMAMIYGYDTKGKERKTKISVIET